MCKVTKCTPEKALNYFLVNVNFCYKYSFSLAIQSLKLLD